MKNQEDTFATELHRLKQQPVFSLVNFESVVDWIRSTVAEVRPAGPSRKLPLLGDRPAVSNGHSNSRVRQWARPLPPLEQGRQPQLQARGGGAPGLWELMGSFLLLRSIYGS